MEAFPCATALCFPCSFLPSLCSFFNSVVVSSLCSFLDPVVTIVIIIDVITPTIVVIVTEGNVATSTMSFPVSFPMSFPVSFPMPFRVSFPNGSLPKIGGIVVVVVVVVIVALSVVVVVVVIVALSVVVMVAFAFCALSPFAPLSKLASTFHVTNLDIVFVSGLSLGRFFEHGRIRVKIHHWVGGEVRYAIRLPEEL